MTITEEQLDELEATARDYPIVFGVKTDITLQLVAIARAALEKDRRIAELEAACQSVRSGAAEAVAAHDAQVARIAELEALNVAGARAVDVMDDIGEQARARIKELEAGLREAVSWIADRSSDPSIFVNRLSKLLPSDET